MGIPTLIATVTGSDSGAVGFTSGIDSTYDEYMFVCTDIHARTDATIFGFQVNAVDAADFNETVTSTYFRAYNQENGGSEGLGYEAALDQAQGTAYQNLAIQMGSGSDESCAGILHLFSPANTTYVTHWYARFDQCAADDSQRDVLTTGYFNITAAIDEISFKMASGNMDGVIQMFGIA